MEKCLICWWEIDYFNREGGKSLKLCAELRNDSKVENELESLGVLNVYENCRKNYTNRKRILSEKKNESDEAKLLKTDTRSSSAPFNWQNDCFICGEYLEPKTKYRKPYHPVLTLEIRATLLWDCQKRLSLDSQDSEVNVVQARLLDCCDLVAVNAKYHQHCRVEFSKKINSASTSSGFPMNTELRNMFESTCKWLESVSEDHTISQFSAKMMEELSYKQTYSK